MGIIFDEKSWKQVDQNAFSMIIVSLRTGNRRQPNRQDPHVIIKSIEFKASAEFRIAISCRRFPPNLTSIAS